MLSSTQAVLGNEKLAAGETEAALKLILAAVKDAPTPIPNQLFTETLGKIPGNLYFRNLRDEAIEIANILESKAATNFAQLLNIAGFHLSIENGSEARRVAENVIKLDANSAAAYQTLGLANRIDFKLDESASAYAKATELDPESLTALRGLAEMKRSLGLSDEAVDLYREILAKSDVNVSARTGLVLALFDAGKRAEAETEMTKALETNPNNVMLLAGAAYWYAASNEGSRAVELAQKAIDLDPRFIWSHIALARGHLNRNQPALAERTLLAARKYGNFPTLEYEIASARLSAGLYREAIEVLSKSFSIKDGNIQVKLGRRVPAEAADFTQLIGIERRASLFTPKAADSSDNANQLKALLEFSQELGSTSPKSDSTVAAAENFMQGDDNMKLHRQIFVASELLDKKVALSKVVEITKAAQTNLEKGLDVADPATAVMATELYEDRSIALANGRYVSVPNVPRLTLSVVLRGRIEEIAGWASFQLDDPGQAVVHLKRAVGILPTDSAWWRSSTWRLGTALAASGNDSEAIEAYINSYKSSTPDVIRYNTIESLYKRLKGNTEGLVERIGPNPSTQTDSATVAQSPEPIQKAAQLEAVTVEKTPTPETVEQPSSGEGKAAEPTRSSPSSVEAASKNLDQETPLDNPLITETEEAKTEKPTAKIAATPKELFPPVVIKIAANKLGKNAPKVEKKAEPTPTSKTTPEPTSEPIPEIKPCILTVNNESPVLTKEQGSMALIVKSEGNEDLEELKAVPADTNGLSIRREVIAGLTTQALFVLQLAGASDGEHRITFEMPCGKKEITVKVR